MGSTKQMRCWRRLQDSGSTPT
uniref:Uncharacterized protein n=1 Tax=Arundo donax TaxID=35708 RepID=A0A0A9AI85_ARUDO